MLKTNIAVCFTVAAAMFSVASCQQAMAANVTVFEQVIPAVCAPSVSAYWFTDYSLVTTTAANLTAFNVLPAMAVAYRIACRMDVSIPGTGVHNGSLNLTKKKRR